MHPIFTESIAYVELVFLFCHRGFLLEVMNNATATFQDVFSRAKAYSTRLALSKMDADRTCPRALIERSVLSYGYAIKICGGRPRVDPPGGSV